MTSTDNKPEEVVRSPHSRLAVVFLSHWRVVFDETEIPVQDAYESLETLLLQRSVPGCRIGTILLKEAGFWSPKRRYLRVTYNELIYDICVAPLGNATFVSSWLGERPLGKLASVLLMIPGIDAIVIRRLEERTYYQYDSLMAFQEAVHRTVLQWIDDLTTTTGIRPIADPQRKPIMKSLLQGFPAENDVWTDKWTREENG